MVKVITYGTYDLLHHGHIRLLERAKALGDYLIVGVTSDDFDKNRGKINVQQSCMERVEAVRKTGLADEIIIEEYEGQKIDDIKRYDIDIFTVGSDWENYFDYLNEYCRVIYLPRTNGVSSSDLRSENRRLKFGILGSTSYVNKIIRESSFVNGIDLKAVCGLSAYSQDYNYEVAEDYDELLSMVEAVYITSHPRNHYKHIKIALEKKKHVLCESPIAMSDKEYVELCELAKEQKCILMDSIKTAYSTAFSRMIGIIKSGAIGDIISVDSVCTSLKDMSISTPIEKKCNSICSWGPTGMLPVLMILGTDYKDITITSKCIESKPDFDLFSKIDFTFKNAVASVKVGKGVKSEGELVVSGTNGYVFVPSPWWKTDYFELRYENQDENKRYYYQLEGEGFRYELVSFLKAIETGKITSYIPSDISREICNIINSFNNGRNCKYI